MLLKFTVLVLEAALSNQHAPDESIDNAIKQFYLDKGVRPLTPPEIQAKNRYFGGRYKGTPKRVIEYEMFDMPWHNPDHRAHRVIIVISRLEDKQIFYKNGLNLASSEIEVWDNNTKMDNQASGPNYMYLSDFQYQTMRAALESVQEMDNPNLERYKDLSIDTFEPRSLSDNHVIHPQTVQVVSGLIQAYKQRKQEAGEDLTDEEVKGRFFFPLGSREFKEVILQTVLGKAKLHFLGNYFPHLRCNGVMLDTYGDGNKLELNLMRFPLEKNKAFPNLKSS